MVQTGDPTGMEQLQHFFFHSFSFYFVDKNDIVLLCFFKKNSCSGSGKGGTSIWGRKFEDEFSEHLKVKINFV